MNRRTHLKLFAQDCKEWLAKKFAKSGQRKAARARRRHGRRRRRNKDATDSPRGGRPPLL